MVKLHIKRDGNCCSSNMRKHRLLCEEVSLMIKPLRKLSARNFCCISQLSLVQSKGNSVFKSKNVSTHPSSKYQALIIERKKRKQDKEREKERATMPQSGCTESKGIQSTRKLRFFLLVEISCN